MEKVYSAVDVVFSAIATWAVGLVGLIVIAVAFVLIMAFFFEDSQFMSDVRAILLTIVLVLGLAFGLTYGLWELGSMILRQI